MAEAYVVTGGGFGTAADREVHALVERDVAEKLRRLKLPHFVSKRAALVYEGRLAQSVEDSGFFDFIVPAADLLK